MAFKKAQVNASKVAATLSSYPTYVDLSRLGITTLAEAQSVRVYADAGKTTEWAREIVSATEMHVKIPSLTTTTEIYVDWDGVRSDLAFTDTYGRNAVWTGYELVAHMTDATVISSATSSFASVSATQSAEGQIGGTYAFNGTSQSIQVPDFRLPVNSLTIQMWMRMATTANATRYLWASQFGGNNNLGERYLRQTSGGNNRIQFEVRNSAVYAATYTTALDASTWYLVHGRLDASGQKVNVAINGSQVATTDTAGDWSYVEDRDPYLGARNAGSGYYFWNGNMDEVRVSPSHLSDNWITTEYNNQSDEASFWGTWEEVGGVTNKAGLLAFF